MKIVNMTPHTINVVLPNGRTEEFTSEGVARVSTKEEVIAYYNEIPVVKTISGTVEGLPEPQKDTVYIVSMVTLKALDGKRNDCVAPNTSPQGAIRDGQGKIVAVRGFQI